MTEARHPASPPTWDAEGLWEALSPILPGLSVEVVARCESTNTELLDRARRSGGRHDAPITAPGAFEPLAAERPDERGPYGRRAGDTQPCLLVAEHQTRGRGRMGRLWQSSAGASLTYSLALPLQPASWAGLSLAVGVALADALQPAAAPRGGAQPPIGLKWPNDLWLVDAPGRGRKLGGVLIETVPVGARRVVVVGVGLNVQPQAVRDLASGYACLQELDGSISAPLALHRVALPLAQALRTFEREGFAPFAARYAARDLLAGQPIATTLAELPAGTADGVAEDGALRVRAPDGRLHLIASGEVSVQLQPPAEPA
jgi:BirA family biotin operon repressor/biotin-[acetyl-CoA-carboxylase] ligase